MIVNINDGISRRGSQSRSLSSLMSAGSSAIKGLGNKMKPKTKARRRESHMLPARVRMVVHPQVNEKLIRVQYRGTIFLGTRQAGNDF
jgi:hypothetical protein